MKPAVPEIECPFPYRVHPELDRVRRHVTEWTARTGLVHGAAARDRFARADFGWFAAMVYPAASPSGAELMADWFGWLFQVDDQLDDGGAGKDPGRLRELADRMRAVLAGSPPGDGSPPAVTALADLWSRTAPSTTAGWRHRFVRHLTDCLTTATGWETHNRVAGIVPDEASYVPRRRHTGAIYVCMDFIDVVAGLDVPAGLYADPRFQAALNAACDVVCWTNDIHSYDKERALGEVHNLVHVVAHHHRLDREPAMRRVRDAIATETGRFLAAERDLLRAFPEQAAILEPYLAGMRTWIRGNLDWSKATARYGPDADDRPEEYLESAVLESHMDGPGR